MRHHRTIGGPFAQRLYSLSPDDGKRFGAHEFGGVVCRHERLSGRSLPYERVRFNSRFSDEFQRRRAVGNGIRRQSTIHGREASAMRLRECK